MTLNEIRKKVESNEYEFLRTNEHLGKNIVLLGLGGSHAYGYATENSDIDVRGCALNTREQIIGFENFEQFEDYDTDTVIYSFNKLIKLLTECNPSVIEILGLKPEHYLHMTDIGWEMISNRKLFLSKKAFYTFGCYARSQIDRLHNKTVRDASQSLMEQHILNSIKNAYVTFPEKYFEFPEDSIKLYIDKSYQEDFDTEIFMDVNLKHYPLRDYKAMWSEMNNIVKDYSKIGKKNKHAIAHNKLAKHMVSLVKLYYMCFDILEKEEIITYRENEHDLLMDIRNGKYLDENDKPLPEFYEMVDELEKRLNYDKENTSLPDKPDLERIQEFAMSVNERVVRGEI